MLQACGDACKRSPGIAAERQALNKIVTLHKAVLLDFAQECGGVNEAVAAVSIDACVVSGFPRVLWISRADDAGIVLVGLGDRVAVPLAVDDHEMAVGGVVDLDVGATSERGDADDGG